MKILFMGTPDFAARCLSELAKTGNEIVGAVCQPDKPVGRKQELKMPPVKCAAIELGIPVFQPETLKNGEGVKLLESLEPELVAVVAYGKLLPKDFLSYPRFGCINVHASLLPKYRGASPIHWAVINGETETGITVMQMDEGLDTGDILLVRKLPIGIDETTEDMYDKLAPLGASALCEAIGLIAGGGISPVAQDDSAATKVGLLSKETGRIDWTKPALSVHNLIRGLYSWPCTFSSVCGKKVKIYLSRLSDMKGGAEPGEVVRSDRRLVVTCGDGNCVELLELQLEGKKRMKASDLLNGFRIPAGTKFGE